MTHIEGSANFVGIFVKIIMATLYKYWVVLVLTFSFQRSPVECALLRTVKES